MDGKQYRCVLCNRKASPDERRPASTFLVILRKHFSLNVEETDVLCNKCRHKCRKAKDSVTRESVLPRIAPQEETEDPTFASPKQKRPKHAFPSPPSVPLPIPSSSQSHGYCFVCKKPGPKLVAVSHHVRLLVFIRREIIIPSGARCCVRHHNAEELRNWLQEEDVFVVDRGFRDAQDVLEDVGIKLEMPAFMKREEKQLSTIDSNLSRVRWVVEACNGRLKQWQYVSKTLPNSQIPFIGDYMYVRIVAALCNKYRPPISRSSEEDEQVAAKMLHLSQRANTLQERVEGEGLDRRGMRWSKVDVENVAPDFPCYDESELRQLTLGVYQQLPGLLCAKIQSRHISAKQYRCWVSFGDGVVDGWFCKCKAGTRVVGMCGHVTSVIWYLSHGRYQNSLKGVRNWTASLEDASDIPAIIDESDSDEDEGCVEE